MGYELRGVVGDFDHLRFMSRDLPRAVVAPLRQRLGLLPVTDEISNELTGVRREEGPRLNLKHWLHFYEIFNELTDVRREDGSFELMSPAFAERLKHWSYGGRVAYVEADFFGGDGDQTAALWENGRQTWGPEHAWLPASPPREENWRPINAVLARLGAVATGAFDLFDTIGFGQEQDMEGWRWAGLRALDAADYNAWEAARRAEEEADARAAAERDKYVRRDDVPVVLDGRAVMEVLDIPSSPLVGAAIRHLQEVYLERGSLTPDEAATELRSWAQSLRNAR